MFAGHDAKCCTPVTQVLFLSNRVCHDLGIPVREVSPSWSKRELWEEAFVTSKKSSSILRTRSVCLLGHLDLVLSMICASLTTVYHITGSLRLIQHVEKVEAPLLWEDIERKTWSDVSWVVKQFQVCIIYFSDFRSYIFCDVRIVY